MRVFCHALRHSLDNVLQRHRNQFAADLDFRLTKKAFRLFSNPSIKAFRVILEDLANSLFRRVGINLRLRRRFTNLLNIVDQGIKISIHQTTAVANLVGIPLLNASRLVTKCINRLHVRFVVGLHRTCHIERLVSLNLLEQRKQQMLKRRPGVGLLINGLNLDALLIKEHLL